MVDFCWWVVDSVVVSGEVGVRCVFSRVRVVVEFCRKWWWVIMVFFLLICLGSGIRFVVGVDDGWLV